MRYRIGQLTDVHFRTFPRWRDWTLKRVFGAVNQYVYGRKDQFALLTQLRAIACVQALQCDAVLVTGDVTAMGLDAEFELASRHLTPLLRQQPSLVIPGNHDCYVPGAEARLRTYFGEFMGGNNNTAQPASATSLPILTAGPVSVIGCNPCRPILWESSGLFPAAQLASLAAVLSAPAPSAAVPLQPVVMVATHYPVLDRSGVPYHQALPKHGVRNGGDFMAVMQHSARAPHVIVHGHDHHGFHQQLSMCVVNQQSGDWGSGERDREKKREWNHDWHMALHMRKQNMGMGCRVGVYELHVWRELTHGHMLVSLRGSAPTKIATRRSSNRWPTDPHFQSRSIWASPIAR
jgi:hypothetical protein